MFLKRWKEDQVLTRKKRGKSGNVKIKKVHKDLIQMWQRRNDEVTATDLQMKLLDSTGSNVSVQSIRKVRRDLGFEAKSAGRTCQLISRKNVRVSRICSYYFFFINIILNQLINALFLILIEIFLLVNYDVILITE